MYTLIYRNKQDNRRIKLSVSAGCIEDAISRIECLGHHVVKVERRA